MTQGFAGDDAHTGPVYLRRRHLLARLLAVALSPSLASCSLKAKPQPVRPTPTPAPPPTPTPAATATPATVRLPPGPTTASVPPSRIAASPAAAVQALRGAGELVYAGWLDGERGLILARADGSERRLLVKGTYTGPVWNSDGTRLAAIGLPTAQVPLAQIALFNAAGQPVARYPIPEPLQSRPPLLWSPDGRAVLCYLYMQGGSNNAVWVADFYGVHPLEIIPWGWTPTNRLAYVRGGNGSSAADAFPTTEIFTIAIAGIDVRREAGGAFTPFGWAADSPTLFVGSEMRQVGDTWYGPTSLLAIYTPSPNTRLIARSDDLIPGMQPSVFDAVTSAPFGSLLAAQVRTIPDDSVGTPVAASGIVRAIALLDTTGRVHATDIFPPGNYVAWSEWTPVGPRFAYVRIDRVGITQELAILDPNGPVRRYPLEGTSVTGGFAQGAWSPDGRWIAYLDQGGLWIAAATGVEQKYLLAPDGTEPTWKPAQ